MSDVLIRKGRFGYRHWHQRKMVWRCWEKTAVYEPGRGLTESSLYALWKKPNLLASWPWTSSLQNSGEMHFCCLSPSLWYFVRETNTEGGRYKVPILLELTLKKKLQKTTPWKFPGGPEVRTPCFHCKGQGSIPSQEIRILQASRCSQKKKRRENKPLSIMDIFILPKVERMVQ